jgi:hypothetical protein
LPDQIWYPVRVSIRRVVMRTLEDDRHAELPAGFPRVDRLALELKS